MKMRMKIVTCSVYLNMNCSDMETCIQMTKINKYNIIETLTQILTLTYQEAALVRTLKVPSGQLHFRDDSIRKIMYTEYIELLLINYYD
jgi:hypothetical protein